MGGTTRKGQPGWCQTLLHSHTYTLTPPWKPLSMKYAPVLGWILAQFPHYGCGVHTDRLWGLSATRSLSVDIHLCMRMLAEDGKMKRVTLCESRDDFSVKYKCVSAVTVISNSLNRITRPKETGVKEVKGGKANAVVNKTGKILRALSYMLDVLTCLRWWWSGVSQC